MTQEQTVFEKEGNVDEGNQTFTKKLGSEEELFFSLNGYGIFGRPNMGVGRNYTYKGGGLPPECFHTRTELIVYLDGGEVRYQKIKYLRTRSPEIGILNEGERKNLVEILQDNKEVFLEEDNGIPPGLVNQFVAPIYKGLERQFS